MSSEEVFREIADKQRIVITGSEGVEMLSAIMKHLLTFHKRPFDYFENGEFTGQEGSSIAIILASESIHRGNPIPDFRKFHHHLAVICNINHTPANGFSSEDEYIRQYDLFADSTPKGGLIAYCEQDPIASVLCNKERADIAYVPFKIHPHVTENGKQYLLSGNKEKLPFNLSKNHNLQYVGGAKEVLKRIGLSSDQFYNGIVSFQA